MLTMERILMLKQASLFSGLHIHELRLIADIVEETEEDPGEILFNQGEPGDSMYVVVSGSVQILLPDGSPFKTFGALEAFGEMSLLDEEPRSATAKTLEACKFLRIERDKFLSLLSQYPVIAMGLLRVMSRRLRSEIPVAQSQETADPSGPTFGH